MKAIYYPTIEVPVTLEVLHFHESSNTVDLGRNGIPVVTACPISPEPALGKAVLCDPVPSPSSEFGVVAETPQVPVSDHDTASGPSTDAILDLLNDNDTPEEQPEPAQEAKKKK